MESILIGIKPNKNPDLNNGSDVNNNNADINI